MSPRPALRCAPPAALALALVVLGPACTPADPPAPDPNAPDAPDADDAAATDDASAPGQTVAPTVSDEDAAAAAQAYTRGMRFVRDRRPNEAAEAFREAVALDPTHRDAHYNLGLTLVYLSDVVVGTRMRDVAVLDEAARAFQTALALDPTSVDCEYWTGEALSLASRRDEAIVHLRRALALDPNDGRSYKALAAIYTVQGENELARENLERSLELLPDDFEVWFRWGTQLEGLDRIDEARTAYERAIELAPTVPSAYAKLATVRLRLGDRAGAKQCMEAYDRWTAYGTRLKQNLLRANETPGDAEALFAVGETLFDGEQWDSAITWLERAQRIAPDDERITQLIERAQKER